MHKQLFSQPEGAGIDVLDGAVLLLEDITLIQTIGIFPIGSKFDSAVLDYEKGVLTLIASDDANAVEKGWWSAGEYQFALILSIGARITTVKAKNWDS